MQKLFYGGDIITMTAETEAPEAVLVRDDKIEYVGSLDKAQALRERKWKRQI